MNMVHVRVFAKHASLRFPHRRRQTYKGAISTPAAWFFVQDIQINRISSPQYKKHKTLYIT
jgi:hypothetical protein